MKILIYNLIAPLTQRVLVDVSGITFVAFDMETTGFSPEKGRSIEIGTYYFNGTRKQ